MPLLSIILPIYNVKNYLERCYESIILQNYDDFEILLVDDGSNDGSSDLCDLLSMKDSRVKVIHKENGGLSAARNEGLKYAQGEYIYWIDSDDWIVKNSLKIIVEKLKKNNPDILKFNYYRHINGCLEKHNSLKSGYYEKPSIVDNLLKSAVIDVSAFGFTAWSHIYKTSFLRENKLEFVSERIIGSEDFLFNFQAYMCANKIEVLDEPLYYYDLREGSLSQSYKSGLDKKFTVLYTTLLEWIHEHNYTRVEKYASLMYVWRIFGCFSLEYKETSIHNLVEGRDNVKRMISTNEFRKAIKDAIKCNCGFKKNIFLLLMYFKCEPVIYKIFVEKR